MFFAFSLACFTEWRSFGLEFERSRPPTQVCCQRTVDNDDITSGTKGLVPRERACVISGGFFKNNNNRNSNNNKDKNTYSMFHEYNNT